jgi:hypothetical protein
VSFTKDFAKEICDKMDDTYFKYVAGKLPPQMITDKEEALSILAGLGEVNFIQDGLNIKIESKKACSIYWNGKNFEVFLKQEG